MNKTSYMTGKEEGRQAGREEGRRIALVELLEAQLESRFGPLSAEALARLRELPDDQLKQLGVALVSAGSLAELGL